MAQTPTAEPGECARAAQARLARTVNLGPDLGAAMERGWTIDIERSHLEACAQAGFTAVRLLVCLAAHRTPGGLDPAVLHRVETIVDEATELGLAVAVSNHLPGPTADPEADLAATLADACRCPTPSAT
jgi:endoglucanase